MQVLANAIRTGFLVAIISLGVGSAAVADQFYDAFSAAERGDFETALPLFQQQADQGAERIGRHLWRMCASFFIASGSFFIGQPQVFPTWFNETPLPDLLSIGPILVMVYFLVRYNRTPKRAVKLP